MKDEPAFPQIASEVIIDHHSGNFQGIAHTTSEPGLTLRDYFAATALTGMFSSGGHKGVFAEIRKSGDAVHLSDAEVGRATEIRIAAMAYSMADAMLKAKEEARART